ncbi:YfiR family protein [Lacimicrobium alkaliphilum]|uniref:YfiR family protein n=1 Tax=Lacimicrobium alkaliphilum TaxID=1526571 RepID=A0ABQ1RCF4_9ALTE|nr:YfiR family protein [Lacimicrobium alkaliphilum]GGD62015.1 hypothetical protein GCM10011357_16650 [Lacimicrobium alkaliphilum]
MLMSGACKRLALAAVLFMSLSASAIGFTSEQLRAPFLLHIAGFTQFTQPLPDSSALQFCFLEDENFPHAQIFRQAPERKVQGRDINLLTLTDIRELSDTQHCHLLFIGEEQESDEVFDVIADLNKHTISVGESLNFIEQGGMMSVLPLQSKMKIFFNRDAYQKTGLKFSSALLKRVNFR